MKFPLWHLLLGVLVTFAPGTNWASAAAPAEVVEWLATSAIRLETAEARHGFADLQPLKKMIGDARIVSLGEATHGTREFFQLKHRLLEFLASEMGFTIFSIEASMPESYRVNDYVLRDEGDPARLLKGMYFWTWNTEEVLDMIHWMRDFNRAGRGRIEFTGFDMQTPTVANEIVSRFVSTHDAAYVAELERASKLTTATAQQASRNFGSATGSFPIGKAAGKRVRFSGWIKTEGVSGYAGLWWRVDGPGGVKGFANLREQAPKGTTDWKRYELEIDVAADATNINFGVLVSGEGTAWFDALAVELDGQAYGDPERFDFGFESPALKGFGFGTPGYEAHVVSDVFSSGVQSLRIRRTGPAPAPAVAGPDPKQAATAWKEVVQHLEASRDAYLRQGAPKRDTDWVIQNARVVRQGLQSRAKEVSRDRSMAENVKWILDQNPGAKIVLWAHNGHISTGGYRGYEPMGKTLREFYGEQMVTCGFAFNEGSFQAIETGKGLRDFTVPPAPAGGLDVTLAATGIPIFAVDLRSAPKNGPVAEWLKTPQRARSIGAVYSENSPSNYFSEIKVGENFDVLLFVEKTTAARKNPPLSP